MDDQSRDILDEPLPPYYPPEPRVRLVLMTQTLLCILGAGVFQLIAMVVGWANLPALTEESAAAERWQVRLQLGLGHFLTFAVPGFLAVWLFYRSITGAGRDWPDYLRVRRAPGLNVAGQTILLMIVSLPLVLFALQVNQLLPLPEALKVAEEQTEGLIRGMLRMDNVAELLANLTVVALLPAIGEEIIFRGVIQQQLMRRIANPWVGLVVSAAIFSFFHFQFEGFLPRLILGLLLGWLYWRTGNFWVAALAHFFNNGVQIVGQYFFGDEVSAVDLEKDVQVPWFGAAVSVFLVWTAMRLIDSAQAQTEKQPAESPQDGA